MSARADRRAFLKGLSTSGLLLGGAGCIGQFRGNQTKQFRLAHVTPADNVPIGITAERYASVVEEKTSGAIEIEVYPAGELGTQIEQMEGIAGGSIEMGLLPPSLIYPEAAVPSLPYLFDSFEEALTHTNLRNNDVLRGIAEDMAHETDVRMLTYFPTGHRNLNLAIDKDICKPADLSGVQIRSPQTDYFITCVEGLGADPVGVGFTEIPSALSTGSINGTENNWVTVNSLGLYEFLEQIVAIEYSLNPTGIQIHNGTWTNLSSTHQEQLVSAAHEVREAVILEELRPAEKESRQKAKDNGVDIVNASPECPDQAAFKKQTWQALFQEFPRWEEFISEMGLR